MPLTPEAADANYNIIYEGLAKCLQQTAVKDDLRIKCEFDGEKRVIQMKRPIVYGDLVAKIQQYYDQNLLMRCTVGSGQVFVLLHNQTDLDAAIRLADRKEQSKSLRIQLIPDLTVGPPGKLGQLFGSKNANSNSRLDESRSEAEDRYQSRVGSDSPPLGSSASSQRLPRSMSGDSTESGGQRTSFQQSSRNHGPFSDSVSNLDSAKYVITKHAKMSSTPSPMQQSGGTFPRAAIPPQRDPMSESMTFPRCNHQSKYVPFRGPSWSSPSSERSCSASSSSSGIGSFEREQAEAAQRAIYTPTNWQKGRILGSGAFGQVFLCFDTDTGCELAVKQVRFFSGDSETSKEVKALRDEIRVLQLLQHSRIVQYFGSEEDGQVLSIFMEYMPGGSVKDQIRAYGPLTETLTKRYTRQVLEGLHYLHSMSIVHRDVKGANILRDHHGYIKLGDFGASKRLQTLSNTMMMTTAGTPYYMSPEVIDGHGYGRKTDIWSLGCTVVEMLSGNPPWADFEGIAAIYRIATSAAPEYKLPPRTTDVAKSFLLRCFVKEYDKRPTAIELFSHPFVNEPL